jgi:rhodanese-related sulfurtransferase
MRSLRGTSILRAQGVENAFSMKGGIEAWAERIDPEMPRY